MKTHGKQNTVSSCTHLRSISINLSLKKWSYKMMLDHITAKWFSPMNIWSGEILQNKSQTGYPLEIQNKESSTLHQEISRLDLRDSSAVKSTYCSYRELRGSISSTHVRWLTTVRWLRILGLMASEQAYKITRTFLFACFYETGFHKAQVGLKFATCIL